MGDGGGGSYRWEGWMGMRDERVKTGGGTTHLWNLWGSSTVARKGGAGLGILDRAETPQHRNLYRQPCDLIPRLLICPPTPAIAGTVPRTYHLTYRICLHVIFFRSSMLLIVSHFSASPVKSSRMSFHCPTRFGGVTTSVARE